jgi:disulfide bond formation protein DsbB
VKQRLTRKEILMRVERLFNVMTVLAITLFSAMVITYETILRGIPCSLCFLLHLGFLFIAFGFLLNLRFGLRSEHYAIVLFSSLFTNLVALRLISLRPIIDTKFSSLLFGLHLTTWSFIISLLIMMTTIIILGWPRQNEEVHRKHSYWVTITHSLFAILAFIVLLNLMLLLTAG